MLQPIINVDVAYIEEKTEELCAKDSGMHLLNGELITEGYLDNLCEGINENLQEQGQLTVGQIAGSNNFPVDFSLTMVKKRMKKIIQAQLNGNTLFTQAHVDRQTAKLRGLFTAITKPTTISSLLNKHDIEDKIAEQVLPTLVSDGTLPGVLKGKPAREYVPHMFAAVQSLELETFFSQNQYMDLKRAKKLQVSDPHKQLLKKFPDCVLLESCVVGGSVKGILEAELEEAADNGTWFKVSHSNKTRTSLEREYEFSPSLPSFSLHIHMIFDAFCIARPDPGWRARQLVGR